ncbi:MAG: hypothetical protein IKI42_01375 [Clostridia bacterium]|nr:hypothetical protein [Clostridia bacterium]
MPQKTAKKHILTVLAVIAAILAGVLTLTACGTKASPETTSKPETTADNIVAAPTDVPAATGETATDVPATPAEGNTAAPTAAPTDVPATPTEGSTAAPTETPTETPTDAPTKAPTPAPTDAPTNAPDTYPVKPQTADNYTVSIIELTVQPDDSLDDSPEARAAAFRALLDELQPDVVGMQKVSGDWNETLDTVVFNASYLGLGEARGTDGETNPIYYRADKFDKLDSGTFWLSETPDVSGSMTEGANLPRICTWVALRDRSTGIEFTVLNTHLDNNGDHEAAVGRAIRLQQMGYLVKGVQHLLGKPIFFPCNLNNRIHNNKGNLFPIQKLIRGETSYTDTDGNEYSIALADARLNAKETVPEDRIACKTKYFDESSEEYDPAYEPVDFIFYDPVYAEALKYDSILYTKNGVLISDHLPLVATFRIIA